MNVVLWVQYDTVRTRKKAHGQSLLKPALDVLNKCEPVKIVGVVESTPMPINKLDTIDKRDVAKLDFDLILVTGHDVDLAPILDEAKTLGLDTQKFILDSVICMPGFSIKRNEKIQPAPKTAEQSLNIVLWVQYDTVRTHKKAHGQSLLKPALDVLNKIKPVKIIGVVESVPMPINKLETIDKTEIAALNPDLILVTGHNVDLAPILDEAKTLGLDTQKFVLDSTICKPGFSLTRKEEIQTRSVPSELKSAESSLKVVLWVQYDTVRTKNKAHGQSLLKPALDVLNKIKPVKIVGVVESVPMPINKLDTIDKTEIAALNPDLILVTGHAVDIAPILDEAKTLGLDTKKFVLDSTICKPGFSLTRKEEIQAVPKTCKPATCKPKTSEPSMNVVLWVQYDTIRTHKKAHGQSLLKPALEVLNELTPVKLIGVVESTPMPINKLDTIDKRDVAALDYDLILVTGHDVDLAPILAEAKTLGLDVDKIVLDRTVLVPGFTPARYKELRNSNLSILSMGWWAGLAYHRFGLPELSPTVGMYTSEENFMQFLPEALWHLKKDLHFEHTEYNADLGINFPVFWLDGTRWFMNSFTNDADALESWNARRDKINRSNILVTMHTTSPAVLERFDCLPYAKKACFVPFETDLESGFYLNPELCGGNLLQASEGVVTGTVTAYDVWDLLLYGKKVKIERL